MAAPDKDWAYRWSPADFDRHEASVPPVSCLGDWAESAALSDFEAHEFQYSASYALHRGQMNLGFHEEEKLVLDLQS
jgi:hypothetical protein